MKRLLFVALLIVSLPLTAAAADPITWKYAGTVTWTSMSIPLGSATTLLVTVDTDVAPADCGWGDPLFVCFPNALLAISFSVNGRTWTTTVPTSLGVYQDTFGPVLYAWVDGLVGPNLDSQTPDLLYFWVSVPTLSGPLPTQAPYPFGVQLMFSDHSGVGIFSDNLMPVLHVPLADAGADQGAIVGESVLFDGSGSSECGGAIESYVWDFGDGASGQGATTSHTYAVGGDYTVTLTVTNDEGAIATDTAVVNVQTLPEAIESLSGLVVSYNIQQGIGTSLDSKLQTAEAAVAAANAGRRQDAANKLLAFLNAVQAQRGRELTTVQADELKAWARRLLAVL